MSFANKIPCPHLHLSNNFEGNQGWRLALAFVGLLVTYIAILALLVIIVSLIMKFLGNCNGEDSGGESTSETSRLLRKEVVGVSCGTCECEEDAESGECSSTTSSSEDLCDAKICIICYDHQRNCFFIPCGHSATCYNCAQRIKDEESKTCPVCRRYIRKVRRLFVS